MSKTIENDRKRSSIEWYDLYNSDNVELCYDIFISTFLNIYNRCIRLKRIYIKIKTHIFLINKIKNVINKIIPNNKTDINWEIYNSIKKQFK